MHQSVTGKTTITLPSLFKEIIVEAWHVANNYGYNYHICYEQLTDTYKKYLIGQGTTSSGNYCRINVSKTNVILDSFVSAGSDSSSSITVTVYYR